MYIVGKERSNTDMSDQFSMQPTIRGVNISIRPLDEMDFDDLYSCASDKGIWSGHPSPDRYKLSEFRPYFKSAIDSEASVAVIENSSDKIIGLSRYYFSDSDKRDISIGFTFLAKEYWGGKTNYELKKIMLEHAFRYFNVVWFHIGPTNVRSQKATLKIGAHFTHEESLKISGKAEVWRCYKIEKQHWIKQAL